MARRRKSSRSAGRSNRPAVFLFVLLIVVCGVVGYWFASNRQEPSQSHPKDRVVITKPVPRNNDVENETSEVPINPKKDPVRQALEAQLADAGGKGNSAFPAGTKLVDVQVKDGTATVELSPEFRAINNSGDTVESLAYKSLRTVLAQFPDVKYMRVLVDGKVFEGEHSGSWAEVPVRDDHARVEDKP